MEANEMDDVQITRSRGGSVLRKKTILKSDHFSGCQNKRLTPHINGSRSYRQVTTRLSLLLTPFRNIRRLGLFPTR
jgi:hypothetical protein